VRFFLKQRGREKEKFVRLTEAEKKRSALVSKGAGYAKKGQKYLLEIFFCDCFFFLVPPFITHARFVAAFLELFLSLLSLFSFSFFFFF